ncbi:hypothetical protein ACWGE0_08315 [Lentzea sp. NPDC054927]
MNTTGVYELYVGSPTIYYYVQKGETVMLVCHAWNGTYYGLKPGWRDGWMRGFDLNTGHDPNPNVPPCN